MPIKLIATDIDGTFIRNDHTFNEPLFRRLLNKMNAQNIHFVVASGNQLGHLTDMFAPFDNITFLAENGGLVIVDGKPIFSTTIPNEQVRQAVNLVQTDPHLQNGSVILSGINGAYLDQHTSQKLIDGADYFYTGLQHVNDLSTISDQILKIDLVWDDTLANQRAKYLQQHLPETLSATVSGFGGLDIIPAHVNKAVGLSELERYWQIDPADVVTFGDNDNDLAMLTHAGRSFAMLNAADNIKTAASDITKWSNDDDGVLRTIELLLANY